MRCQRRQCDGAAPRGAVPTCEQAGVIGVMAGPIGCLQAMEAVKYILGVGDLLTGQLLTYDALDVGFQKIQLRHNSEAPSAGSIP